MESTNANVLTEMEQDVIGEVMNISLGSSATSLSSLLNQRVEITVPKVNVVSAKEFQFNEIEPAIGVEIKYIKGISGYNVMLLKRDDIRKILNLLMSTEIEPDEFELDEISMSAVGEVMNQMMGSAATALADFLGRTVNISTPTTYEIEDQTEFKERYFKNGDYLVAVNFELKVGDVINSEFVNVIAIPLAKELVSLFMAGTGLDESVTESEESTSANDEYDFEDENASESKVPISEPAPRPIPSSVQTSTPESIKVETPKTPVQNKSPQYEDEYNERPRRKKAVNEYYEDEYEEEYREEYRAPRPKKRPRKAPSVNVRPVEYESFDEDEYEDLTEEQKTNLELIMTVPLRISVEIGRTKKKIKDILEFSQGTIVELDKQAGTQVDIIANGQIIAKGDVVIVNDNYGVRVTEIVKREELVNLTKK